MITLPRLVFALSLLAAHPLEAQDFEAGLAEYETKGLWTALSHWEPDPANLDSAVEHWKSLADTGDARAQFLLGIWHRWGRGVPQSGFEAERWFTLAAEQGLAVAQVELANIYSDSYFQPLRQEEALGLYLRAAEQNLASAQFRLGDVYARGLFASVEMSGKSVARDHREALRWYLKAAEQGHVTAQKELGYLFESSEIVGNASEAVRWYRRAAENGHDVAQLQLGEMYADGEGVLQDFVLAHMWLNLAGRSGWEVARELRDKTAAAMTSHDISEAQRRARDCLAAEFQGCE